MGCDIHIYAEVKNEDGSWAKVPAIWSSEYAEWGEALTDNPYQGRNYRLFSLLANVRNGYGFAGCDTGNPVKPISLPRGLPDDISDELQLKADEWDCDGHSHSWLALRELQEFDWNGGVFTLRGYVTKKQAEGYRKNGVIPTTWCGRTNNPNMLQIEWCVTYRYYLKQFIETAIPRLEALGNSDSVRIVFWFDN